MGSIALAGALTGLGRGMVAQAEYKQKINFVELEAARQERLAAIQAERDDQREARREASEVARDVRREEHDVSMARTNMEADIKGRMLTGDLQSKQQERGLQAEAEQKRLDRETELKKARIAAGAKGGGSGAGPKFKMGDIKTTVFNPQGVAMGEKVLPGLFEESTGTRFAQTGNQLFLVTVDKDGKNIADQSVYNHPKTKRPGKPAIAYLVAHPETFRGFLDRYGYLPVGWRSAALSYRSEDE